MGKMIVIIVGLVLGVLGLTGIIGWWEDVVVVIKAGIALALFFVGIGLVVFGIGELRTPPEIPNIKDEG